MSVHLETPLSRVLGAKTALLVPIVYHGVGLGVLAAFDRGPEAGPFSATDEQLLQKAKQVGIGAALQPTNVRIIDSADELVHPKRRFEAVAIG